MTTCTYHSHTQHPSHCHRLELSDHSNSPMPGAAALYLLCSGCQYRASGPTYLCRPCNFALHARCARMAPLLNHPGHQEHPLNLLTAPAYHTGGFICNGCGQEGSGFVYHCAECRFDLHIDCASKPLRILDQSHCHELHLAFNSSYGTREFICDVCGTAGGNSWLYHCSSCDYDVHFKCAVLDRPRPAQMVTPAPQQAPYAVARRPAHISSGLNHQYQYQTHPFLGQSNMQGVNPNSMNIGSSQHQTRPAMRPPAAGFGAHVAAEAAHGLVEGITEGVVWSLPQYVMGSSGDGDGNGDGDF